jgi:hypothetical protein
MAKHNQDDKIKMRREDSFDSKLDFYLIIGANVQP